MAREERDLIQELYDHGVSERRERKSEIERKEMHTHAHIHTRWIERKMRRKSVREKVGGKEFVKERATEKKRGKCSYTCVPFHLFFRTRTDIATHREKTDIMLDQGP